MNKKGWVGGLIIFILIVLAIMIFLLIYSQFLSSGSSTDVAYGVEKNKFWSKLYLKDDHKTVYCMDNPDFIQTAQTASELKQKVKVDYQEYVFRGSLCGASQSYDYVVVTNIRVME